ncbi:Arylesterase [Thiorhodococcus drewsii AZ1]|uniref:Arylesterase n=1 Tax=Thiorhodococcus drewsii AZ1 TaxID=765913 RepID=G2E2L4_9GAMM|nr:arylesterase [Thiorhodococcus drewsii]EGV30568.1 Arylesterase [Thiorhodococcus drewsii AZ1]
MIRLLLICILTFPAIVVANPPGVLVLGDSLSAGYGLGPGEGWVSLLAERLKADGRAETVVNASVSGDTTAGGLTRLPSLLARHRPAVLVIELGANDGLRGLGLAVIRQNLTRLVQLGQDSGCRVLLIGVRLPPNYGASYTQGFQSLFGEVAESLDVSLVPALLADVAEHWDLMQADGLHPRAKAQGRILDNVWPALEPLLSAPEGH